MNIIPVFPASQQGTAPAPTGLSAGKGTMGFDDILGRELQLPSDHARSSEQNSHLSNLNQSVSQDPQQQSAANSLFSTAHQDSSPGEMLENLLQDVKSADSLDLPQPAENRAEQFDFTIPFSLLTSRAVFGGGIPLSEDVSGSFNGFKAIPADIPAAHANHDQAEQSAGTTLSNMAPTAADRWANMLQPMVIQTDQSTQQPIDEAMAPRMLTFGYHSSISTFFATMPDTHKVTAGKPLIEADFSTSAATIMFSSKSHPPVGTSAPVNPTAIAPSLQVSEPHSMKIGLTGDGNNIFSENSPVSFLLSGQPDRFRTPQTTTSASQTSLLLQELQKVIADNNDSLTITATLQRRPVSDHAAHDFFARYVQQNADLQNNTGVNLLKAGTGVPAGAEQSAPQAVLQFSTDPLRPHTTQRVHEQFLNTQATVAEQNSRNSSDNQTLQQHSQSQDGASLQQAPGTAPTGSTSTTDPTALSSTFGSQFQESGSAQNVDAVKTVTPTSPQLNLIRDQEVINQIVERFNLHSRQQTSRLSLQLHPAELGELKIDLIVKGDALKANIYTQTQRAGEIIDRNLSRLREILQDQGISVDELVVSFKSEGTDDFTPHQGRLFQDQSHLFNQQRKPETAATFAQTIEDTLLSGSIEPSGVNLTI